MPLPEVSKTEPTPLVRSRWLAPGVMETSLVGATLKGSCVPTLESIQLEGCRPQPKRSRRCWRRLGGCWMLSGCLRQPGFGSPSPPRGGPERPRIGKCHRGANENVIWSQGCRRGCQLLDRDLSCRLGAQVRGKEAKLNRATLRLGDLDAEDDPASLQVPRSLRIPRSRLAPASLQGPRSLRLPRSRLAPASLQVPRSLRIPRSRLALE